MRGCVNPVSRLGGTWVCFDVFGGREASRHRSRLLRGKTSQRRRPTPIPIALLHYYDYRCSCGPLGRTSFDQPCNRLRRKPYRVSHTAVSPSCPSRSSGHDVFRPSRPDERLGSTSVVDEYPDVSDRFSLIFRTIFCKCHFFFFFFCLSFVFGYL